MLQHNKAAICSITAATNANAAGTKEVTDALASIHETKKAVDDAKEYLLKATANANAIVVAANAFALKTTSDAFNSPALMYTDAFTAAKTATADAAKAAKKNLSVVVVSAAVNAHIEQLQPQFPLYLYQ